MIRNLVAWAALALVLATTSRIARSQSQSGGTSPDPRQQREQSAVLPAEASPTLGLRRFGPLYEAGRPAPATDDQGWPADWDQRPHLSLDIFSATREFNSTRDFRRGPAGYGPSAYGPSAYGSPPSYGGSPNAPYAYGNGAYPPPGYANGGYAPQDYRSGSGSRNLFSSDSAFALRYGYPGESAGYGVNPPPFGYPAPGSPYAFYPPPFGYGPYGGYPPQPGYGPGYWGGGLIGAPPGRYGPYFYW